MKAAAPGRRSLEIARNLLTCTYRYVFIRHMHARETGPAKVAHHTHGGRPLRALNLSLELLLGSIAVLLILGYGAGSG